jgi:hypothetical protein
LRQRLTHELGRSTGVVLAVATAWIAPADAQSEYRNLDGGRPVRVEDATGTARHAIELELGAVRVERVDGRGVRWHMEPRLAYGLLPRTEVKLRAPIAVREKGATPRGGLVGIAVGVFHNFNTEGSSIPAFAVEGDVMAPAAGAAARGVTTSYRGIVTRSLSFGRVHANVGYGTYWVRVPQFDTAPNIPIIIDHPCALAAAKGRRVDQGTGPAPHVARACAGSAAPAMSHEADVRGSRRFAGVAVDHAFPLRSLLLIADVFAERYTGPVQSTEWAAELGARWQMSVRSVVSASLGRRVAGFSRSWFATISVTTSSVSRMLIPETR